MSNPNIDNFQGTQVSESKFWRKFKQDPAVPIGRILSSIVYFISLNFQF